MRAWRIRGYKSSSNSSSSGGPNKACWGDGISLESCKTSRPLCSLTQHMRDALQDAAQTSTHEIVPHHLVSASHLLFLLWAAVVVQSPSCVWLYMTPRTAVHKSPLSSTISCGLFRFISIEPVMLSNQLILCPPFSFCLQSLPASGSFLLSHVFTSGGQSIGASASATVLPMNIQVWFSLGLTGLISLQSKGLSRVFSSTTIQKHQFFSTQPSLWTNSHIHTWLLENP